MATAAATCYNFWNGVRHARIYNIQPSRRQAAMSIHLIHIPDRKVRERALKELLKVRENLVSFPKNVLGVTDEHIGALKAMAIPFDYVSRTAPNGTSSSV
jgi:hypothetical protein